MDRPVAGVWVFYLRNPLLPILKRIEQTRNRNILQNAIWFTVVCNFEGELLHYKKVPESVSGFLSLKKLKFRYEQ